MLGLLIFQQKQLALNRSANTLACCFWRNGIQQRRNSWQDGVYGTNCPILPGRNFTYVMQVKDQIGSYFYFPSIGLQKAAGGFGAIRIWSRPLIPVPFPPPAGDFMVLAGDWFKFDHNVISMPLTLLFCAYMKISDLNLMPFLHFLFVYTAIETPSGCWSQSSISRWASHQWPWLERIHIHSRSRSHLLSSQFT